MWHRTVGCGDQARASCQQKRERRWHRTLTQKMDRPGINDLKLLVSIDVTDGATTH